MYQIEILPKALRSLQSLDEPATKRILDRLSWLSENLDVAGGLCSSDRCYITREKVRVGNMRLP